MRRNKWIGLLTALSLCVSMLAGCGSTAAPAEKENTASESTAAESDAAGEESTEAGNDAEADSDGAAEQVSFDKEVELVMYCIGDEGGIYADDALANLNAMLKEKINATIKPVMVSWGEYKEKMPLIYASGEAYDLVYVANWMNYATEALKGPFMELSELMPAYAPKTYAELKENGALDTALVDGKLYMVPSPTTDYTTYVTMWREDLRKKYDVPEITDWESLGVYMEAIKENEPDMFPMATGPQIFIYMLLMTENDWAQIPAGKSNSAAQSIVACKDEAGSKAFNVLETPEYEEFVTRNREYYQKGYWSRNVLSETRTLAEAFDAGQSAITIGNKSNALQTHQKTTTNNPDWEIGMTNFDRGSYIKVSPTNNGMAIGINSKNPERAMAYLELINQDEEVFKAMYYGIEGTTYAVDENGCKITPEGVDPSTLGLRNLGMGTQVEKFMYKDASNDPRVIEEFDSYESSAIYSPLAAFIFDDSSVAAECAAVANVLTEYKLPLDFGVSDPETALPELRQKVKDAGIDKIIEEVNRQLDEFYAAQ